MARMSEVTVRWPSNNSFVRIRSQLKTFSGLATGPLSGATFEGGAHLNG